MSAGDISTRTTQTTVTFTRPFTLAAFDGEQPAGTYRLVIDEEEIPGISFLAYRRVATTIMTPATSSRSSFRQAHVVDRDELNAALDADKA